MSATPPNVALGELVDGGLAPAILAMVDRGVRRKPQLASGLDAEVELVMPGHPPVRISFGELVRVEDGAASRPVANGRIRVEGRLALLRRFIELISV